ncbi:hypothetical protein N7532_005499 [Penicillium argentinense]|uniref:GPI-anchored cell surface glycoprotein n=1 Tax=Penicillium argentinense TaxID=1131581 RepID=A0A9W9FE07_9EURO|nr:uncharacterized protein N7532_005499 [Penicillium argentinense]KAJ5098498.1 hypothetical protein N7532_005499 [Penicillium argentinense]
MSLNGLETPAIVEAYQSALADAGGWFLLHYVSRDEVALLERGTGGVAEVRNAIENYEETSPLYGFLHYRRRKVILRYMPEGLSRLIQARSNVQFQSVTDKFSPNDTVLALTQASELSESSLSSACLLHTASGSITSSSSSLRRRRLMEITEDAEESGAKEETKGHPVPPPKAPGRQRSGSQISEATVVPPPPPPMTTTTSPQQPTTAPAAPPPTSPDPGTSSPDLRPPPSRASSRGRSPSEMQSVTTSPRSPDSGSEHSKYRNILDEFPRPSEEARMSTQSARPSLRELERAAGYTPKVKLGPRPSVDQSGRPRTAGSSRNPDQRPVASLPSNMRSSSVRKSNNAAPDPPRPRSQGSSFASRPNRRAPPIPPLLVPPPSIPISRPQLSPGAKSLGALSTSSGLTPEKERLMKALQQRKKNMAKRAESKKKHDIPDVEEQPKTEDEATKMTEGNKENISPEPESGRIEIEQQSFKEEEMTMEQPLPATEVPHDAVEPQKESRTPAEVPVPPVEKEAIVAGDQEELTSPAPESISKEDTTPQEETVEAEEKQRSPTPGTPEPESSTAVPVSNSEGEPSSHTSGPSADTTFSSTHIDPSFDPALSETPQTVWEDEARADLEDSAILGQSETKSDLVPPSAVLESPLDREAPEVSDAKTEPGDAPFQQPEASPAADQQLEKAQSVGTLSEEATDSTTLPATSFADAPPSPVAEPSIAPFLVSIEAAPEQTPSPKAEPLPLDQRRRIHLEPIQVPTQEYSDDDNLLSDDSFMEELRSATVQEARPVSVKSPNGGENSWKGSRAVSSPHGLASPSAVQALHVGRSASSTYPENGPSTPVLMAKKINVSSGISSRIKALEKFSSREGTPSGSTINVNGPSTSSSFENLRKRASVSFPNGTTPDFSRAPSVNHHDSRPASNGARRTNSISVTARIIRDSDASPDSAGLDPTESDALNLQASPLTVEHDTSDELTAQTPTAEAANRPEDRSMSISSVGSSRQAASLSRPGSRLSVSSRSKTDEIVNSSSPTEEKKGSRASRLMRRVSSITSNSRRSIIGALSPPVKEEDIGPITQHESAISPSPSRPHLPDPIDIGEVNVQFPDTLLWKRRFMRIDQGGYLVLAPGTTDAAARNMTKRYHLSEFRTPCLPDEDMQELPNSILLDFLDGSTLQCACESRQGQASALQTLVDAHNAHQQ